MSEFGIEIYAANGQLTLGMQHFTIRKIFEAVIPRGYDPARRSGWTSEQMEFAVSGYDPATCFVVIKPRSYGAGYTPTFRDVGSGRIAIVRHTNWREYTNDRWYQYNRLDSAESTVEVVKVLS